MRDDISQNLEALDRLMLAFGPELLFVESGGDNLAAQFSRELADYTIYVIDVSGGDKIPRKGGPGITQSDLLVINKTDLAALVGADLSVMERDATRMRGDGPIVFAQVTNRVGTEEIAAAVLRAWPSRRSVIRVGIGIGDQGSGIPIPPIPDPGSPTIRRSLHPGCPTPPGAGSGTESVHLVALAMSGHLQQGLHAREP